MSDTLTVSHPDGGRVTLTFRGMLDESAARTIWDQTLEAARAPQAEVVFDLADVTGCDGPGLALLSEADQQARANGASTTFQGASDGLAELMRMAHHDAT